MRPGSIKRKALGTVGVLTALAICAASLQAAIGWQPAAGAPRAQAAVAGSMALVSSDLGAIFTLSDMGPGDTGQGEVTISNDGSSPGALELASTGLSDAPGRFGGLLSERLLLQLEEIGSGKAVEIYSGQVGAMPELELGSLAAGESRTYRFRVTMLDGGEPPSPFAGDNLYQRATTGVGYEWTLTATEGGVTEPEPPITPPPAPGTPSAAPGLPAAAPKLTGTPRADRLVGGAADDVIVGLGGADRIYGKGGADRLYGGSGRDRLFGGPGSDLILARGGGADLVDCGGGQDVARVDRRDRVRGCERVR